MKDLFLNSKETRKKLKISSCQLMHLRTEGKIEFIKKGNAYFYKSK
ncbi:hypothetical protein [Tenacibaculum xiamenense]